MGEKKQWEKNKREYNREYDRENKVHICVKLNRSTDPDLIEIYQAIPNKAQWIKDCLRRYAIEHPKEKED